MRPIGEAAAPDDDVRELIAVVPPRYDSRSADVAPPAQVGGQIVVGSYGTLAAAERALDHLSGQRFPVRRMAVVGRGLSSFKQVAGRLTAARAAGRSALSSTVLGVLLGWLFGLFHWVEPVVPGPLLVLYGALLGAVAGGLLGLLDHALTGGLAHVPVPGVRAHSYDVLVETPVAAEARRILTAPGGPGLGRMAPRDLTTTL